MVVQMPEKQQVCCQSFVVNTWVKSSQMNEKCFLRFLLAAHKNRPLSGGSNHPTCQVPQSHFSDLYFIPDIKNSISVGKNLTVGYELHSNSTYCTWCAQMRLKPTSLQSHPPVIAFKDRIPIKVARLYWIILTNALCPAADFSTFARSVNQAQSQSRQGTIALYNVSSTAAHIQLSQTVTEDATVQCLALWAGFMAPLSPSPGLTVHYCSLQARGHRVWMSRWEWPGWAGGVLERLWEVASEHEVREAGSML